MQAPVLAIVGPTASGKSALALDVAGRVGAEIVAVDAFTIYRNMDIGTATPSREARASIPHHLVNLLDPSEECTAQAFQVWARDAIDQVLARGRPALLVGGSGLYFRAVVDHLQFPPTDPAVRADIEARHPDGPSAHRVLQRVDPPAASRIQPANRRRSIRALEVLELTGRPFSDWQRAWDDYMPRYPGLKVVGVAVERRTLQERIARRLDAMLAAGLVEEARALRTRPLSQTARTAIGYAELWAYLDGVIEFDETRARIITRTRRFAVRQQRWFAADPRVSWVEPSTVVEALTS